MSVEVWYGDKSHHEAEQNTLLELFQHLNPQKEHFVLLHNFFAGQSNEIDIVVLKRDGIFLAELKHVWDHIVGGREGDWKAIHADGTEIILNPDRPNPFKQAQRNYHSWKNWCQEHAAEICPGPAQPNATDWHDVMTYVVLYPDLPQGSEITIGDWPVQAVGLPAFLFALVSRSSKKIRLSRQEMSRIPKLMGLKRWQLAQPTEKLSDWQPAPFATLVARGHTLSDALIRLDHADKRVVTVGRAPENDLIIAAPTVSRHHAELRQYNGRWIVRDLNSTSGTFVSFQGDPEDEVQVREREFALKDKSIVRFGPAAYTLLLHGNAEK